MKLTYNGKGEYGEWANAIWNRGYNYSITSIPSLLGVSISWVKQVLLKNINYVVYENNWIYKKTRNSSLTYINKSDLSDYIKENGEFFVQTEIVDLAYYLKPFKAEYKKASELLKESRESYSNRGFYDGTIPQPVLDYINRELLVVNARHNWSSKERSKITWSKIEPFDIFEHKNNIYYIGDYEHDGLSNETFYRNVFLRGDIRIKLGKQISIFYKRNQKTSDMKMPYLVPYGTKIKIFKTSK